MCVSVTSAGEINPRTRKAFQPLFPSLTTGVSETPGLHFNKKRRYPAHKNGPKKKLLHSSKYLSKTSAKLLHGHSTRFHRGARVSVEGRRRVAACVKPARQIKPAPCRRGPWTTPQGRESSRGLSRIYCAPPGAGISHLSSLIPSPPPSPASWALCVGWPSLVAFVVTVCRHNADSKSESLLPGVCPVGNPCSNQKETVLKSGPGGPRRFEAWMPRLTVRRESEKALVLAAQGGACFSSEGAKKAAPEAVSWEPKPLQRSQPLPLSHRIPRRCKQQIAGRGKADGRNPVRWGVVEEDLVRARRRHGCSFCRLLCSVLWPGAPTGPTSIFFIFFPGFQREGFLV